MATTKRPPKQSPTFFDRKKSRARHAAPDLDTPEVDDGSASKKLPKFKDAHEANRTVLALWDRWQDKQARRAKIADKTGDRLKRANVELTEALAEAAPGAKHEKIVAIERAWRKVDEAKAKIAKIKAEDLKQANAELKEAMELGHTGAAPPKLARIETAWQDLDETKSKNAKERKTAKQGVEEAHAKISDAIEGMRQLDLPGMND